MHSKHNGAEHFLNSNSYRGSPTYTDFTTAVPTTIEWIYVLLTGGFSRYYGTRGDPYIPTNANFVRGG